MDRRLVPLTLAALLAAGAGTGKPAPKDPKLQEALHDNALSAHWIYNDLDRAFLEAKKNGKPLLAVIRCVP